MSLAKMIEEARVSGPPCVCGNVRAAARALTQVGDEILRPSGLRMTQVGILMATMALEPVTMSRLAQVTATDRTTLARNLKPLLASKLVTVDPGAEDRRERVIQLTDHGRKTLERAYPLWEKVQERVLDGFGRKRWEALRGELRALVQGAVAP
jgi:DNA-binding MarR family transcriptional regulator